MISMSRTLNNRTRKNVQYGIPGLDNISYGLDKMSILGLDKMSKRNKKRNNNKKRSL